MENQAESTREAVIRAAGGLFAERGFHGVTARQVAAKAGVSLGAIPYHFGSMEVLYRETLIEACRISADSVPFAQASETAEPHEGLLLAVRGILADYSAAEVPWQIKLIERESLDPSPEFREVVKRKLRPEWDWLCRVVGRAAEMPDDSESVRFGVLVMHTLGSTFLTYRRILREFAPDVVARTDQHEELAALLAHLTLDAIRRYQTAFSVPQSPSGKGAKPGTRTSSKRGAQRSKQGSNRRRDERGSGRRRERS